MPIFLTICFALGMWMVTRGKRRRDRRRTQGEVDATFQTGLPSNETAMGRKAREVAAAQDAKLHAPPPVHGTARWATPADAITLINGDLLRGRRTGNRCLQLGTLMGPNGEDTGMPLAATYPGHILTVAGTGQGKSATQIVQNLLTYNGAAVVIDPKGELYDLTASHRRRFGPVYRLAPLARQADAPTQRYNPMDELADPRELGSRSRRLAEMLIVRQGDKGAGDAAFFENEAVNLLTSILMFVVEITELPQLRSKRNLSEVRRICTLPVLNGQKERDPKVREYIEDVFKHMGKSKNPYIRNQGSLFAGYDRKLLGAFMSEINSNMAFFDGHPGFAESCADSDFSFAGLPAENGTVYLTIPLKDTHTSFRYIRAMIGCAFAALEEQRDATEASLLFILDEFPALRDMAFMRDAVAQMRSSGAWFWFFVQDVAQLQGVYGKWADVFLSQTDHQVYFGATLDAKTKDHVSQALGVSTYAYRDANITWSQSVGVSDSENGSPVQPGGVGTGRNVGQSINIQDPVVLAARSLMTPFEVGTFLSMRREGESHPATAIIFSKQAGGFPVRAYRQHWRKRDTLVFPPMIEHRKSFMEAG